MLYAVTGMGGEHVIIRKIDGAEILRRVEQHGVTLMCGAPAVVNMVLDAAAQWDGEIPGRDRVRIVVAGAPPPTRTIERVETELGWEFNQIYGLTETSPLLTINRPRAEFDDLSPADRAVKLNRAGAPAIGCEMDVDDEGEVLARSNVVMAGYWEQPEATAEAIVDGWFHTGDGGSIDEFGYVTISDRKKDVIISGGENVSSIEVEDAIFQHPDVTEVAVIGIPDEKWGELVTALVVQAPGSELTSEEVIAWTRQKLAGYKCPKRVEFRDALDRTATGKLQKFKLRAPFWEGQHPPGQLVTRLAAPCVGQRNATPASAIERSKMPARLPVSPRVLAADEHRPRHAVGRGRRPSRGCSRPCRCGRTRRRRRPSSRARSRGPGRSATVIEHRRAHQVDHRLRQRVEARDRRCRARPRSCTTSAGVATHEPAAPSTSM